MPKKVKTKKQKMLADLRRKNYSPELEKTDFTTYSIPTFEKSDKISTSSEPSFTSHARGVSTAGYGYLPKDLRKTILLTCSIIIAEILIKFYFKI